MCCMDDDYRKNAGLAGVFDIGTGVAVFVINIMWLRNYEFLSLLMYGFGILVLIAATLSLIYAYKLDDLLNQNKRLQQALLAMLGLSLLVQVPLIYLVSDQRQADQQSGLSQNAIAKATNSRGEALIAVYLICAFHSLCALSLLFAMRSARRDIAYAAEQSAYEKEYNDEYNDDNSRYDEELLSPHRPVVVSFGDQNPAGSFVSTSETGKQSYSQLDSPRSHVALSMPKDELNTSDVISNHSELDFSHYSPSLKTRSYPKLSQKRDTSRRSDRSLHKLNPHIYNRVKSIDLELGGSDDEDIASKTTLVIRGP